MNNNYSPFRDHRLTQALDIITRTLQLELADVNREGLAQRYQYTFTYTSSSNILTATIASTRKVHGLRIDNLTPLKELRVGWQTQQTLDLRNTSTGHYMQLRKTVSTLTFSEQDVTETRITRTLAKIPRLYLENALRTNRWK